jgi:hypothetical protein
LHAAAICLLNSAARLLITAHRLTVTAMPVRPAIDAADPDDRPEMTRDRYYSTMTVREIVERTLH